MHLLGSSSDNARVNDRPDNLVRVCCVCVLLVVDSRTFELRDGFSCMCGHACEVTFGPIRFGYIGVAIGAGYHSDSDKVQ